MNLSEARWQLARPAAWYMGCVEQRYRDIEDGLATLEESLPSIRLANQFIEAVLGDSLPYVLKDGVGSDDRFRLSNFVPL